MGKIYKGDVRGQERRRRARRSAEAAAMIAEIKKSGCVRCGEAHPGCLDFHHVDPSTKYKSGRDGCVAELASRGVSWKMVAAEIAKCELICSNCHRKQHWEERLARVRPPQPEQLRLIGR